MTPTINTSSDMRESIWDILRIIRRIQQDNISFDELIRLLYRETPPAGHNYLAYHYAPHIDKVRRFGDTAVAPLFSVVIATYNRSSLLAKTLAALARQTGFTQEMFEIVIADNGSEDATEKVVADFAKSPGKSDIVYIKLRQNYGADFARNIAVLHLRGSLLAFTDDDCIVPNDWLFEFKKELDADPEIAGVGGFKEPKPIDAHLDIYHRFLMWGHFKAPHVRSRVSFSPDNRSGLTANVCYRRDIFDRVGGFNIYFKRIGFQEFALRVQKFGWPLLYEPRMVEHAASFSFTIHIQKCLAQGWGWYLRHVLHPDVWSNPTFFYFLTRTSREIRDIVFGKAVPPLYSKSLSDVIRFSLLSALTKFCLWFGKYWIPLQMRKNPHLASHDTAL